MYFNATVRRGATVQFLPQNVPETAWRPGSALTRWGNLTYSTLRFRCQDFVGYGIGNVQVGKEGKKDWKGGKRREGKVKGVVPHPKQKSGCATATD